MCSFREASACCLGVFTHIVLLLLSASSDVGTVDFRLLVPSQKNENPNWPIKYKLRISKRRRVQWNWLVIMLLCFFLQWDKQPESTVVLTYVFPVVPKLLYQRFRQIVCICVHLTAQIVLLTSPPRQLALALVPIYLSSIQGEVFKLSKLLWWSK